MRTVLQYLAEAAGAGRDKGRCVAETSIKWRRQRLAAGDKCPSSPATVAIVFLFKRFGLNNLLHNLLDVADFDKDVLGLEICVDDSAFAVEVVESKQNLLCDLLDKRHGNAAVVPFLDKSQQGLAKDLKDHAHMGAVRALVLKRV